MSTTDTRAKLETLAKVHYTDCAEAEPSKCVLVALHICEILEIEAALQYRKRTWSGHPDCRPGPRQLVTTLLKAFAEDHPKDWEAVREGEWSTLLRVPRPLSPAQLQSRIATLEAQIRQLRHSLPPRHLSQV